jgi:hypothetical protein
MSTGFRVEDITVVLWTQLRNTVCDCSGCALNKSTWGNGVRGAKNILSSKPSSLRGMRFPNTHKSASWANSGPDLEPESLPL